MVLAVALVGVRGEGDLAVAEAEAAGRPNIVFILTDDMRKGDLAHMPKTRSLLGGEGTTFSQAFVTTALCCPSRASIPRGQYAHNHGVTEGVDNPGAYDKFRSLGRERSTVATWLSGAGYKTALFGKYLNGYGGGTTHVPAGWGSWRVWVDSRADGTKVWNVNGSLVGDARRHDNYVSDEAVKFVSRQAGASKPYFLYLAPYAPHVGLSPAAEYRHSFDGVALPKGPSFNEADVSDKPAYVRNHAPLSSAEISTMRSHHEYRLEMLKTVDEMVGRLVAKLKGTGQMNNTYVVFTSDNGYRLGEHRLNEGKWAPYEEDHRVPLLVRGPGVPHGAARTKMVLNTDFAPTFAALAGAQKAAFVDGRSIGPLLGSAPPSAWRTAVLEEGARAPWRPGYSTVRTTKFAYTKYGSGESELYNLIQDPYELRSLHANPDYDGVRSQLSGRLSALKSCAGSSCRSAEGP